jgi:hypothetical protein
MKKLIAAVCAFIMLWAMAVPAFANQSPASPAGAYVPADFSLVIKVTVEDPETGETSEQEFTVSIYGIAVAASNPKWLKAVTKLVEAVNDPKNSVSFDTLMTNFVKSVNGVAGSNTEMKGAVVQFKDSDGNVIDTLDLSKMDLVSCFSEIVLNAIQTNEKFYDVVGKHDSIKVTLIYEQLKNLSKTNLGKYRILLIQPETAEAALLKLDPDTYKSKTGEITVEFPFMGVFALILLK